MAISQDEREFFVALGNRIARLRKDNQLTQVQLAETLGISQPTMNAYEFGQRRVPVSALPILARALGVGLDELLGQADFAQTNKSMHKRGPAPRWQQQIEAIAQLPKAQQRFVSQMLDTVLAQQGQHP